MSNNKIFQDSDSEEDPQIDEDSNDSETERKEEDLLVESADSDSDDAPDDVGFEDSKLVALETLRNAVSQIEKDKKQLKQKRRQLDEKYVEQKKQKLDKLLKARLPDDFLEQLSSKPLKGSKSEKSEEEAEEEKGEQEPTSDGSEHDYPTDEEQEDTGAEFGDELPEFITLDKNAGVQAVCIKEELKKSQSSAQKAADFMQQRLYGGKVPRESTKSMLAKRKKKSVYR